MNAAPTTPNRASLGRLRDAFSEEFLLAARNLRASEIASLLLDGRRLSEHQITRAMSRRENGAPGGSDDNVERLARSIDERRSTLRTNARVVLTEIRRVFCLQDEYEGDKELLWAAIAQAKIEQIEHGSLLQEPAEIEELSETKALTRQRIASRYGGVSPKVIFDQVIESVATRASAASATFAGTQRLYDEIRLKDDVEVTRNIDGFTKRFKELEGALAALLPQTAGKAHFGSGEFQLNEESISLYMETCCERSPDDCKSLLSEYALALGKGDRYTELTGRLAQIRNRCNSGFENQKQLRKAISVVQQLCADGKWEEASKHIVSRVSEESAPLNRLLAEFAAAFGQEVELEGICELWLEYVGSLISSWNSDREGKGAGPVPDNARLEEALKNLEEGVRTLKDYSAAMSSQLAPPLAEIFSEKRKTILSNLGTAERSAQAVIDDVRRRLNKEAVKRVSKVLIFAFSSVVAVFAIVGISRIDFKKFLGRVEAGPANASPSPAPNSENATEPGALARPNQGIHEGPPESVPAVQLGDLTVDVDLPGVTLTLLSAQSSNSSETKIVAHFETSQGDPRAFWKGLAAGAYQVVAQREGWSDQRKEISVMAGQNGTLRIHLPNGGVRLTSSPPGASVRSGGLELGQTPLLLDAFPAGAHVFVVDREGWPEQSVSLVIPDNGIAEETVRFASGSAKFMSHPSGADVTSRGINLGKTPLVIENLPAGNNAFEISLEGFQPKGVALQIPDGGNGISEVTMRSTLPVLDPLLVLMECWSGRKPGEAEDSFEGRISDNDAAKERSLGDILRSPPKNGIVRHLSRETLFSKFLWREFQFTGTIASVNRERHTIEFGRMGKHPMDFKITAQLGDFMLEGRAIRLAPGSRVTLAGKLTAVEEPYWSLGTIGFEMQSGKLLPLDYNN